MTSRRIDVVRVAGLAGVAAFVVVSWVLIVWGVRWLLDVV